jgi:hypothetical protein
VGLIVVGASGGGVIQGAEEDIETVFAGADFADVPGDAVDIGYLAEDDRVDGSVGVGSAGCGWLPGEPLFAEVEAGDGVAGRVVGSLHSVAFDSLREISADIELAWGGAKTNFGELVMGLF